MRDAASEATFFQTYGNVFSLYVADKQEAEEKAAQVVGAPWRSPGDTVSSFLAKQIGGPPATGEHVTIENIALVIEAVDDDGAVSSALVLPSDRERNQGTAS